ncbi:MAG: MazG-like family protein [Eubacteriales bacterium]
MNFNDEERQEYSMSFVDGDLDITRKIKHIEKLKSSLLSQIADLFVSMSEEDQLEGDTSVGILADILILTYLLSNKLGTPNEALDLKVINKLKLAIIENENNASDWHNELTLLQKHLIKTRTY